MNLASIFKPAHPGEVRLRQLKKSLKDARTAYAAGEFSGHPEEQLQAIDYLEWDVAEAENAKARGWIADSDSLTRAMKNRNEVLMDKSDSRYFDERLRSARERVRLAAAGLI